MNTSSPRIALLVPCRNAARFLPTLWRSVDKQTRAFAEHLVYDDASTDDTAEVATRLGARVIAGQTQLGPAGARNRLLAATTCEWIHFHDADDILAPEFVSRMSERIRQDLVDVILCQVDWRDAQTDQAVLHWRYHETTYQTPAAPADMLVNVIGGIGGTYRVDTVRGIGGFRAELRYWEDMDFHLRLWRAGARFAVIDEVLSIAYRHGDSTSNSNLKTVWRCKTALLGEWSRDEPAQSEFRRAIGQEAERILGRQLELGDAAGAKDSLALASACGIDIPTTKSPILRLVRHSLGCWQAARLQWRFRKWRAPSP